MRRRRSRLSLGLSVSLVSGLLATSCGSNDIDNLFSTGGGGFVSGGAGNQAGRGAGHAGTGNRAGNGAGDEGGGSGEAGAQADGGVSGSSAGAGGSHAGSGGHAAGAAGGALNGGSSGKGGNGGTAGSDASAGKAGNAGGAGKAGSGGVGGGSAGSAGNAGSLTAGSAGNAGSAGSGESAGSGGNGGSAGNAGNSGNSGSAGNSGNAGSAGAGGASCLDNGACGASEYCAKPSCTAQADGHCTPRPTSCSGIKQATVCGCDGITYHDACLLHSNGQNSNPISSGECAKGADTTLTCTSSDEAACTAKGGLCAFKGELSCIIPTVNKGVCWILPANCPGSDDQRAHSCNAEQSSCTSECTVIKSRQNYSLPPGCN